MSLQTATVLELTEQVWSRDALPALSDYIRIPNVSPAYDPGWVEAGHMERAVELVRAWCASRPLPGATVEVVRLEGRTPVVLVDVPATDPALGTEDTVVLYGHLDKQPGMEGWRAGLSPWEPVVRDGRLYGRGSADDGYAAFAALTALEAVRAGGGAHRRALVLIEAGEESGSPDLPAYLEALLPRMGTPSLVVCLDSGLADWDHLWVTTSLRGLVGADVTVRILTEGVHSGSAGGVVPSSFRLLRRLLSRVEDEATGRIVLPELHVELPALREREIADAAGVLGDLVAAEFPWVDGPPPGSAAARLRAKTWEPSLAVVGLDGAPPVANAGNVLRASTSARLSVRIPPGADPVRAQQALVRALESDPPEGAEVTVVSDQIAAGWEAPALAPWLTSAVDAAAQDAWGRPPRFVGEGGTIPFMHMLGEQLPAAQLLVTGVLGPESNAHGPNEFLDLASAERVTRVVAQVLDAHARR